MNNNLTIIQFVGDVQGYLELDETTLVPITYSISDIRDISKKTGAFSKSIKVKGTKNNNKLLNHYFDVNIIAGTFDINAKQSCIVIQNGVAILDNATIQLIDVSKKETTGAYDEQIEYTLLVKDMTSDFFTIISNKYLEDLDLKIPNHTFNGANVINTDSNTYEQGYKYHLSFNQGEASALDNFYGLLEFKPAIFVRKYFDRIFAEATATTNTSGYRYNFPSMNDNDINLNKLIIPYNGEDKLTNSVLTYSATASGTTAQIIANTFRLVNGGVRELDSVPVTQLQLPVVVSNPDGLFNSSTSTYTMPSAPSNNSNTTYTYDIDYEVYLENTTGVNIQLKSIYPEFGITPSLLFNGVPTVLSNQKEVIPLNFNYTNGTHVLISKTLTAKVGLPYNNGKPNEALKFQIYIPFKSGSYWVISSTGIRTQVPSIKLKINSVRVSVQTKQSTEFGYGATIVMNDYIPNKIKQSDFIKGIFTMFNLYAEVDRYDSTLINISKRDNYYDNGALVDWTNKLVKDDDKQLTFLPLLTNKKLILSYKEDDDIANTNYVKTVGETYGQQEITFDNQYVKDVQRIEPLFSPTPMEQTKFGAIVPTIVGAAPKNNIRILYAGDLYDCDEYFIRDYNGQSESAMASSLRYSSVSHFDRPTKPSFDLNFGTCDFYFIDDDSFVMPNNLYNLHWRRTINQINNGKMLTAKFNLNELDIANMRLSDKILVNNSYWNINRVIDYDANSNEPTKVELISIDDGLMFPFTIRTNYKVKDSSPIRQNIWDLLSINRNQTVNTNQSPFTRVSGFNNWVSPTVYNSNIIGSNNSAFDGSVSIQGSNNIVSRGGIVNGSFNTVEADNVMVFGSNNAVTSGGTDAVVLGNGITATTGNGIFANNVDISSGGTLTIGAKTIGEDALVLMDAASSTGCYFFNNSGITAGVSANTFNVGAVKGWIVDPDDVLNSNPRIINYSGASGLTTPYLLTAPATFLIINSANTLTMLNTRPTMPQRRGNIYLGAIAHPIGTLTGIGNNPDLLMNEMSQVRAMFEPTRLINEGVLAFPFNNTLTLANTAGLLYGFGIGFVQNGNNAPSILTIPAGSPTTFQYRTYTGQTFANTTVVSANTYDVGGVATTIGGATNRATNQRIYLLQNGVIRLQFGQTIYGTLAEAIAAAQTEPFIINVNAINFGILIGILSIKRTCTDLSNPADARFLSVSKFGESVGAAGGISTATLQSAYNNSADPEIVTNSTLGGLTIRNGLASNTGSTLEIYSNSPSLTASIKGAGIYYGTGFVNTTNPSEDYFLMSNGSVNTNSYPLNYKSIATQVGSGSQSVSILIPNSSIRSATITHAVFDSTQNNGTTYTHRIMWSPSGATSSKLESTLFNLGTGKTVTTDTYTDFTGGFSHLNLSVTGSNFTVYWNVIY